MDGVSLNSAKHELIAIVKQVIELTSIGWKVGSSIEQLAESVLYDFYLIADAKAAAQLLA
jgi:hypothetical protein